MAIFAPLTIGRDALRAHERALQTTGQNIANVNTPGYSRQQTVLTPVPLSSGSGVRVAAIQQAVDPFLEARRLASASTFAGATAERDLLDRVQALVPVQGPGVGTALQEFFAAANALAVHPQDIAVRTDLLGRAESLAAQLRTAAAGLAGAQRDADGQIAQSVNDANGLLRTVADLNRAIVAAEIDGSTANELRDTRRDALGQLAQILEVHVLEQADGSTTVFAAGGAALVVGAEPKTLATEALPSGGLDGNPLTHVGLRDGAGGVITLPGSFGGTLGARIALRDQTLPAHAADLDLFATTLRDAVNAVQTDPAGRDLDGVVGMALFAGTGAADLTVALSDPRGLAAARSSNLADNAGALELAALADTSFPALGGTTLNDFFGVLQSGIGDQARSASDRATIEEHVASALAAQRDSVSGVSLEEEFVDLIRFQRGFQAASQLITTSNRMLEDLLDMVR